MTTPTLHQAAQMAEDTLAALWDRHAGGKLNIDSACPAFIDRAQKTITALRAALAQPAAPVVPDGWVSVPREPTPEMVEAPFVGKIQPQDWTSHKRSREMMAENYRAMIAAAPQAVPAPVVPEVEQLVRDIHRAIKRGKDTQDHGLIGNLRCILDHVIPDPESAAPAVREPLTQDQIVGLAENYEERYHRWVFICVDELEQFARAIEKAHGIGTTGGGNG